MEPITSIIIIAVGAALGFFGCGSETSGVRNDGSEDANGTDGPTPPLDGGVDHYIDGGDGGKNRTGINDNFAPLPFCSGRNIFTIKEGQGVGFCGENPARLYTFPISEDLSSVTATSVLELPEVIGDRSVLPTTIRDAGPGKVILPMMDPTADDAATFLMVDVSAGAFVGPQVNATGLQIGVNPIGDPIPISGLDDMVLIGSEFWGVLSNPNTDGTYRLGFGLALPQTVDGLVDTGVPPNMDGIVDRILSNRVEGIGMEMEPGTHFSFATTDKKPTNVEDLGGGLIAIQNSGTTDGPASIDTASNETHQLLENRNVSLGSRELSVLPRLAADLSTFKAYPATATSLWEVDLSDGAPAEQENEIPLSGALSGQIAGVVVLGGQAVVGDSDGNLLFVALSGPMRGEVVRTIDVGSGLSHIASDETGKLFVSVENNIAGEGAHIISVDPTLL